MEGLKEMCFEGVIDGELSNEQSASLFENMKSVVVSVLLFSQEDNEYDCEGTGVFISNNGHILTLSHILFDDYNADVHIKTFDQDEYACNIIHVNKTNGLAILQVSKSGANQKFPFARINDGKIQNGEKIYSIGHSHFLDFSYAIGRISCRRRRYVDVRNAIKEGRKARGNKRQVEDPDPSEQYIGFVDNLELLYLKDSVSLVQVNNIHGDGMGGSSGMPIFNCRGHIIGLYVFVAYDQCFGIHARVLKSYIEKQLEGVSGSGVSGQASTSGT